MEAYRGGPARDASSATRIGVRPSRSPVAWCEFYNYTPVKRTLSLGGENSYFQQRRCLQINYCAGRVAGWPAPVGGTVCPWNMPCP